MPNFSDISGRRFGRLLALSPILERRNRKIVWQCVCDCGNPAQIVSGQLVSGITKSCGCLKIERDKKWRKTHGMSRSRTYSIWTHMIQRCHNMERPRYKDYGGKGIFVCDLWRESFEKFLIDMGEAPKGKSIDRIDNKLGYFKENCRWASAREQSLNSSRARFITFANETLCINDWAKKFGVPEGFIRYRINKGYTFDEIVKLIQSQA